MSRSILVCLILLAVFQSSFAGKENKANQPNIIFILADDLGNTDLSCAGSDLYQTPNIDRLAGDGMFFHRAYSSHPTCQPSRLSLQTGKYPARLGCVSHAALGGVTGGPVTIPKSEVTIGEALQEAGYTTCHIGKWHIGQGDDTPEFRGYDYDIASNDFCCPVNYFFPYSNEKHRQNKLGAVPDLEDRTPEDFLTEAVTDEAVNFIRTHNDKPFFLNMSYYAVHTPIQAEKEKVQKYKGIITKDHKHRNATYAGLVEHLDDGVGRILDVLEEQCLTDNTIVIFMSDNGGEVFHGITKNFGLKEGKGFSYEGGVRVPMIVKWPGVVEPGTESNQRVIGFDLYPTILKMANTKGDKKHNKTLDGYDLTPLLKDANYQLPNRELHFLRYLSMVHFKLPVIHRNRCVETVLKDDWKLMEFFEMPGGLEPFFELYNLKEDPSESNNLADEMPEKVKELQKSMKKWRKEVNAPAYDMEKFYGSVKID